jgi:hypothetical protein
LPRLGAGAAPAAEWAIRRMHYVSARSSAAGSSAASTSVSSSRIARLTRAIVTPWAGCGYVNFIAGARFALGEDAQVGGPGDRPRRSASASADRRTSAELEARQPWLADLQLGRIRFSPNARELLGAPRESATGAEVEGEHAGQPTGLYASRCRCPPTYIMKPVTLRFAGLSAGGSSRAVDETHRCATASADDRVPR